MKKIYTLLVLILPCFVYVQAQQPCNGNFNMDVSFSFTSATCTANNGTAPYKYYGFDFFTSPVYSNEINNPGAFIRNPIFYVADDNGCFINSFTSTSDNGFSTSIYCKIIRNASNQLCATVNSTQYTYTYNWSLPGGGTSTSSCVPITNDGNYCVTVTTNDGRNIIACNTINNKVGNSCNFQINYTGIGDSIIGHMNTFEIVGNGSTVFDSIVWNFGEGNLQKIIGSLASSKTYSKVGVYPVYATAYVGGSVCYTARSKITIGEDFTNSYRGIIFNDKNVNGLKDPEEAVIPSHPVNTCTGINNVCRTSYSDYLGRYKVPNEDIFLSIPYITHYTIGVIGGYDIPSPNNIGIVSEKGVINGAIFNDVDNDDTYDDYEGNGYGFERIKINTDYVFTYMNGRYQYFYDLGEFNVSHEPSAIVGCRDSFNTIPNYYVNDATTSYTTFTDNFKVNFFPLKNKKMSVEIFPTNVVSPNSIVVYDIVIENQSSSRDTTGVILYYSDYLKYVSSSLSAIDDTVNNKILWNSPIYINPGATYTIRVNFKAKTNVQSGDLVTSTVQLSNVPFLTACNFLSQDTVTQVAVNSYDPNNKIPVISNNAIPSNQVISSQNSNQDLYYVINFQNTGTGSASNVVLIDSLSPDLDSNTFEIISTSHAASIAQRGNKVNYIFNNILLAPAVINETGSHGYVIYKIKSKNGLPIQHHINDFTDIYFDFNPPIRTDLSDVVMVGATGIENLTESSVDFEIFPNPAKQTCNIVFHEQDSETSHLVISDISGNVIKEMKFQRDSLMNKNSIELSLKEISQGIYFITLMRNNKNTTQKLIKL